MDAPPVSPGCGGLLTHVGTLSRLSELGNGIQFSRNDDSNAGVTTNPISALRRNVGRTHSQHCETPGEAGATVTRRGSRVHSRMLWVCLLTAFAWGGADAFPLSAQHHAGWGPHFGGFIRPDTAADRIYIVADVGLFSELGKGRDGGSGFQQYNGVASTVGVTQLSIVRTSAHPRSARRDRQRTWFLGGALIDDGPTSFLQNDLLHDWLDQAEVPRRAVASGLQVAAGIDETHRVSVTRSLEIFGGGGLNMVWGLIAESYVQGGFTGRWVRGSGARASVLEGSCTGRLGMLLGSDWYLMGELEGHYAPSYHLLQCRVGLDASTLWGRAGGVLVDVGVTRSSGLFLREPGGKSIWETFLGVRVTIPRYRIALETWNDVVGGKDQGPTFGLGLSFYR